MEEEGGEDFSNGGTGGGMSTFGDMDCIDGIDPEPLGNILIEREILSTFNFFFGTGLASIFGWSSSFFR